MPALRMPQLNEARLIFEQRESIGPSNEVAARFEKLVKGILEDLDVVRERVQAASNRQRCGSKRRPRFANGPMPR